MYPFVIIIIMKKTLGVFRYASRLGMYVVTLNLAHDQRQPPSPHNPGCGHLHAACTPLSHGFNFNMVAILRSFPTRGIIKPWNSPSHDPPPPPDIRPIPVDETIRN